MQTRFRYDPGTGAIHSASTDKVLGYRGKKGYVVISYRKRKIAAHRLAFFLMTGSFPPEDVDHINGAKHDNRWVNLRAVSRSTNLRNMKRDTRNKSGITGVCWKPSKRAYVVTCGNDYIGQTGDFFEAACLRKAAEIDGGFTERHGAA